MNFVREQELWVSKDASLLSVISGFSIRSGALRGFKVGLESIAPDG